MTIQDELEARSNCRYGLAGVVIRIRGHDGLFVVWSSRWAADRELVVTAYPAAGPKPEEWKCIDPENHIKPYEQFGGRWEVHSLACLNDEYPPVTLHDVPAPDCTLVGEWPVVCCRPRRKKRKAAPHP
jgi:hypothetical protein